MTFTLKKWTRTCVTFTQRKMRQFYSEKEAKRCGSPHNTRVIYVTRGNKVVFSYKINERTLCDNHTKLSGTLPLENSRICVVVHK